MDSDLGYFAKNPINDLFNDAMPPQRLDYIVVDSVLWDLLVKALFSYGFHYMQSLNLHK